MRRRSGGVVRLRPFGKEASMNDQATAAFGAMSGRRSIELGYDGRAGEVGKIALSNSLLGLVTLGIYRFWAKTRLRRYLWSHVSMEGDRFEYTGRGIELFIGFLIAGVLSLKPRPHPKAYLFNLVMLLAASGWAIFTLIGLSIPMLSMGGGLSV